MNQSEFLSSVQSLINTRLQLRQGFLIYINGVKIETKEPLTSYRSVYDSIKVIVENSPVDITIRVVDPSGEEVCNFSTAEKVTINTYYSYTDDNNEEEEEEYYDS